MFFDCAIQRATNKTSFGAPPKRIIIAFAARGLLPWFTGDHAVKNQALVNVLQLNESLGALSLKLSDLDLQRLRAACRQTP